MVPVLLSWGCFVQDQALTSDLCLITKSKCLGTAAKAQIHNKASYEGLRKVLFAGDYPKAEQFYLLHSYLAVSLEAQELQLSVDSAHSVTQHRENL